MVVVYGDCFDGNRRGNWGLKMACGDWCDKDLVLFMSGYDI
jgi:hypothetical protein